jgi:hypothetical protein
MVSSTMLPCKEGTTKPSNETGSGWCVKEVLIYGITEKLSRKENIFSCSG